MAFAEYLNSCCNFDPLSYRSLRVLVVLCSLIEQCSLGVTWWKPEALYMWTDS